MKLDKITTNIFGNNETIEADRIAPQKLEKIKNICMKKERLIADQNVCFNLLFDEEGDLQISKDEFEQFLTVFITRNCLAKNKVLIDPVSFANHIHQTLIPITGISFTVNSYPLLDSSRGVNFVGDNNQSIFDFIDGYEHDTIHFSNDINYQDNKLSNIITKFGFESITDIAREACDPNLNGSSKISEKFEDVMKLYFVKCEQDNMLPWAFIALLASSLLLSWYL